MEVKIISCWRWHAYSPHQVYHVDIDIKEVIMISGNLFTDRCSTDAQLTPKRVHVNNKYTKIINGSVQHMLVVFSIMFEGQYVSDTDP